MDTISSVKDLYIEFIRDIYHAEILLIPELRFFIDQSNSEQLQKTLEEHLLHTHSHTSRLEELQENLNANMLDEHCRTMKSMIVDTKDLVERCTNENVTVRAMVGALHRITHCMITVYEMLISMTDELNLSSHKNILAKNLEEKRHFDYQISNIGFEPVSQELNLT